MASEMFKWGAELASSLEGMKFLSDIYTENELILGEYSPSTEGSVDWVEFMAAQRFHLREQEGRDKKIAIIGAYPEHGVGSLIATQLAKKGIDSQLWYGHELKGLKGVHPAHRIVVLGGHLGAGIDGALRPSMSVEKFSEMAALLEQGDWGIVEFASDKVPGIWIGGRKPWDVSTAVRNWLESPDFHKFAG